ncbi:MAG: MBL fold metallo-hydrolase [Ferruginibacter sp.]|nr:MBL fold metallo-hydrolase [Ferruginibacter sp.]
MKIEQIYTGCLAQGAYYITSNGEAAIIDPLRETAQYIDRIHKDGVRLKYIFETHFHADFVSGHIDLSKKTNAPIVYGPTAKTDFESIIAHDGQIFSVGKITIEAIHTPGHTLESTTYLLKDENGKDYCIFSGDTLFLGDVGRPDLAQNSANMTKEELAGLLYESLKNKIMPLSDDVIVYPAHGAGSACGKNMMKETVDTLGNQKKVNYALNQKNKEAFIAAVTEGLQTPPAYFSLNVAMNKKGYKSFDTVLHKGTEGLHPDEFELLADASGAIILDARSPHVFYKGFIPQSVNIGLEGDFAPWVGAMIKDVQQPILLVVEEGNQAEAVTRLSRVGFDNILGYLKGGFASWAASGKETDQVKRISASQFAEEYKTGNRNIIDIRRQTEFNTDHIVDAKNLPLENINEWITNINPEEHFYIHCAGGYRSMIASSILEARGYRNFSEIEGGYKAIANTDLPKATASETAQQN